MKSIILLIFFIASSYTIANDSRLFEDILIHLEENTEIIEDGKSFGSRKKTLEKLEDRNQYVLKLIEELELQVKNTNVDLSLEIESLKHKLKRKDQVIRNTKINLTQEIKKLEEELMTKDHIIKNMNQDKTCTLNVFRQSFTGVAKDKESAKAKALIMCSKKYDLQLQCLRGKFEGC